MPDAPATEHDLPPEYREILNKVRDAHKYADNGRKPYIPRWREWYGLHRNYRRIARAFKGASENDRDEITHEAQRQFGAELFIPMAFTTIETVTPRVLMNNPRMKVKPKRGLQPESADAIKEMFEERQTDIDYSLKLQPVARRGLKYGLGVGKTFWERDGHNRAVPRMERTQRLIKARLSGQPDPPEMEFVVDSEGPCIEDVELEDFFWDPAAKDMKTCRYAIHRTWRDERYIRERVEKGEWLPIDLEKLDTLGGSSNDYYTMREARANSSGLEDFDTNQGRLHEIWEYHDGEMVHTILDKTLVVQSERAPFSHGKLPFQIFRPTLQEGEFVGIGEIEPIVHLQYELNTLRSQRRDNATLVLQKAFMYAEGLVDPADLVVGPGKGIPVYGNPNEVLVPLNFGDIPASGYQEEAAIKSDAESTSGLADTVAGGGGGSNASSETATGIQLVQAAANVRVEMKTKLLLAEFIKPQASQWLSEWRQRSEEGQPVMVTVESAEGVKFKEVTQEELKLVRAITPEEESTTPENKPQRRNDALSLYNQTRGSDVVDSRKAMQHLLRAFDVDNAEEWILPEQTVLNPQVAEVIGQTLQQTLIESGVEEDKADDIALAVMQRAMAQTGIGEPPVDEQQSTNGAVPEGAPA